ncbi:retrovirus-related pol polyprotein from transposon TNT 1-94 [Tanacetum coccineum]
MKDLGSLKYFLGVEVAHAQDGILLCQRKYALDIISEVGLLGAKPTKIPIEQNHMLGLAKGRLFENPKQYRRLEVALRVVRFLKRSPGQGILLKSMCDLQLRGWCDADSTKKQHIVSRSSAEAQYHSIALTTCELKWLKSMLLSLGIHQVKPISLYCDSQAALHISQNPVFHERTKHIEVDCHYIRDELMSGNITTQYVSTKEQNADFFTKAFGKATI